MLQLEELAEAGYPNEVCALLEGTIVGSNSELYETANVVGIIPMHNSDESIYAFRIDSSDLIKAYQDINSRNLEVVGIFHSHSSVAFPSVTDMKYMELNPVVWLIYSMWSHSCAAYIHNGKITQVTLSSSVQQAS
jgi:proteasome lid subunit RPN8/RPN11